MDRIRRDTLLGIVFFGTLGFLLWATVNLTDLSLDRELTVHFPQAGSVDVGTNVMVLGKKIGKVGAIDIDYEREDTPVQLVLLLREDVPLKQDYLIEVRDAGVLGGKEVFVDPGRGSRLAADAELVGRVAGSAFDKLGDIADGKGAVGQQLESSLRRIGDFFQSLNDEEGSIGRLVKRREVYDSILNATERINRVLDAIVNGEGAIGALVMNRETRDDVTSLLANARAISATLRTTDGPLGVLLNDSVAGQNLQSTLADVAAMTADARAGKGMLGRVLRSEQLAEEFQGVVHNFDRLLAKANDPDAGALGAITSDAQMGRDLRETIANARTVSQALTERNGLIGTLLHDEDVALRFRRILRQVSRAIEDAREAAPIANFVAVLLGAF